MLIFVLNWIMHYIQLTTVIIVPSLSNLVSKYEEGFSVLTNLPRKAEGLEELFLSNSRPLVGEFTKANQLRVYTHRPLLVTYLDVNWKPGESKSKYRVSSKNSA